MRAREKVLAAATTVAVVAAGGTAWALTRPDVQPTAIRPATTLAAAGEAAFATCGFSDVGRYAAAPADDLGDVVSTPATGITSSGEHGPRVAVGDDELVVLSHGFDESTFTTYTADGDVRDAFTFPVTGSPSPTSFALDGAGRIVTVGDDRRSVVAYETDGREAWTTDLSAHGEVTAVVAWTGGLDGASAAATTRDGSLRVVGDGVDEASAVEPGPGRLFGLPDGTLVAVADGDDDGSSLRRWDAAGTLVTEITGPSSSGANGGPAALGEVRGVTSGPHGGLLIADTSGRLVETDEDGVWTRVNLSAAEQSGRAYQMSPESQLVGDGDRYAFFSPGDDGTVDLGTVTADGMDALLDAPVTAQTTTLARVAQLGYGLGLTTDAELGYVAPGTTPAVALAAAGWWSSVEGFQVRYRVTSDPWTSGPEPLVSGTVDLTPGGTTPLELPPAAPGPYEVHAELVDPAGEVRTATCLRYAVGAEGAALDPGALADGADWGGAQPLRGVQLADQLGIGSSRVQLDFGRLVPDVTAAPSRANLDLSALPGATDGDPFAQLAPAAELAARSGVELHVQVGQGGEAEHAAVATGTWEAWVTQIVAAVGQGAPQISVWEAWNEPNNTGFGDATAYVDRVLEPFSRAVRAAAPGARVIGGDALEVDVAWYADAVAAGACDAWDIVGIHPYTGWNSSWDEAGPDGPLAQIVALREVLAACGPVPIWNTESGWWSDGPLNSWAQAHDAARASLWQAYLGVEEWTYFFSEGGWGENGYTWSLVQYESFVKPGALGMSTAAGALDGRGRPDLVPTDLPGTHVLAFAGEDDELLAAWTDDVAVDATVTAATNVGVTVTDVYGAERRLDLTAGEPADLALGGAPVYLTADAGAGLTLAAPEPLGDDLLTGGTVTVSSSADGVDPGTVVDPAGSGASPWRAGSRTSAGVEDSRPWLMVTLPEEATVDRVAVIGPAARCCTAGLRDFDVSVQGTDGEWATVAQVRDLAAERGRIVTFDPVEARAVRIQVPDTEQRGITLPSALYSGLAGGLLPAYQPVSADDAWPVGISRVSAWGPS
jgi:hypothetical protein